MLLVRSSTPQEANAKDQFFQQAIKDAQDDTVIMVLTSLVPDPVRCPILFAAAQVSFIACWKNCSLCICLLRVDGLRKSVYLYRLGFQQRHFNYNNDIYATANDVTKGLIGPC